jgi:hypothetical protein
MALADLETSLRERLPAVEESIQRQLRAQLPADVALLKDRLEALASERAERARPSWASAPKTRPTPS